MKTVLVALIGLINENNEVLISLRKNRSQYNNLWEFPGGKQMKREKLSKGATLMPAFGEGEGDDEEEEDDGGF